jgi:GNAT superfamily N-acetyltransferase
MHTYFLGIEEVDGYCLHFANRLVHLFESAPQNFPFVWIVVGNSGLSISTRISKKLVEKYPTFETQKVKLIGASFDRANNKVLIEDKDLALLKDQNVLTIDSAIHSGQTMLQIAQYAEDQGALSVASYSLVVKRTSAFIPQDFGVIIGDYDRAVFLMEEIPGPHLNKKAGCGYIRTLTSDVVDAFTDFLSTGEESIDKETWGDLLYAKHAKGAFVYVYIQNGKPVGALSLAIKPSEKTLVDVVAVDNGYKGKGIGGALMRWAETLARSYNCSEFELWSINREDVVSKYQKQGFAFVEGQQPIKISSKETYSLMRKPMLHRHGDIEDSDH